MLAVFVAASVVVSTLAGMPAEAADFYNPDRQPELQTVEMPDSSGNKNKATGAASEIGEALAEAVESKKPVVVDELTTETERVIAQPDGSVVSETAQAPVRGENDEGDLVPLDPTLEASDGRLEPAVASEDVSFSSDGSGDLARLELGKDASVALSLAGDVGDPVVKGGVATYDVVNPDETLSAPSSSDPATVDTADPEAATNEVATEPDEDASSGDLQVQAAVTAGGFAANVVLAEQPSVAPEYVFDVDVEGLTPKLVDGVLQLRNADGKLVADSAPLEMWDATVDEYGFPTRVADVDAELAKTAAGVWQLTLKPTMDYLTDKATKYPVVVDPTISPVTRQGDTYFNSVADLENFGKKTNIRVGYENGAQNEGYMSFSYNPFLGANVTNAELKMWQYASASCDAQPTDFRPMTIGDTEGLTWDNRPQRSSSGQWLSTMTANRGLTCAAPNQDGYVTADVTPLVNGWAGEHVGSHTTGDDDDVYLDRQAFFMEAGDPTDPQQFKAFCSLNWDSASPQCGTAAKTPVLSVTFTPELGQQDWYSMTERQLTDRMGLSVNNRNGNLFLRSNDVNVNGIGLDFTLDRTYNSQGTESGPLGRRWSLSMGPDVYLEKVSDYRYDFHAPGGTVFGSFVRKSDDPSSGDYRKFSAPLGGVGAELEQRSNGIFDLTFRKNQMKYTFAKKNGDGDAFMTGLTDRSDNVILINYLSATPSGSGKPKVSSFEDTAGRNYTPTYNGARITKIETGDVANVGIRSWNFTYDTANVDMIKYGDAIGAETSYEYVTASGTKRLSKIIQPSQGAGAPTTEITYKSGTSQIGTVGYRLNDDADGLLTYSWAYSNSIVAACEGDGDVSTVVTDPRNKKTTYCYEQRDNAASDAKTWVYDALGNAKSEDFNADNQPTASTNASGQGVAGGSTVARYNDNISDQLSSITEPKNSGSDTASSTVMTYDDNSTTPGGAYLPVSVKGGDRNCNYYGYDSKGRTTSTMSGATTNSAGACDPSPSGRKFEREYNDNGTLKKSWDANSGSNPTDADKTIYTYWETSDTGYVAGTAGQLKSVRKPGGDCSTGASRKLCTSYAYDGAARVTAQTDARGNTTQFVYDANDRTRGVNYPGWNFLTCPLGADPNCIRYNYDANGNLYQRYENGKLNGFGYDRLSRQIQIATPATGSNHDKVSMAYDGAGNMIGYQQEIDGVATPDITIYSYDDAGRPQTMLNTFGIVDFKNDDDGRMTEIAYEAQSGAPGTTVTYEYQKNGRPKQMKWKNTAGTTQATWDYDYTINLPAPFNDVDVPQMQSRKVTSSASGVTAGTREYEYSEQRLTKADDTNGTDYDYTYDNVGNILSEKAGSTTTHYGYNRAGERCWSGSTAGSTAQKLSQSCATGPSGSTAYSRDADGNNQGLAGATNPITYNDRNQVTSIDGLTQDFLDQGNDLRTSTGNIRTINGPLGVTAYQAGTQTVFLSRTPSGQLLTFRPTDGTSLYYVTEPNGNVALVTNPFGYLMGSYQYSPYGKTSTTGLAHFNPFRYLSAWQETNASGDPGHYKFGARFYDTSGMFTQPDAITGNMGDPRTMTSYNYAGGDPINRQDSSGYFSLDSFYDAAGDYLAEVAKFTGGGAAIGGLIGFPFGGPAGSGLGAIIGGVIGTSFGLLSANNKLSDKIFG